MKLIAAFLAAAILAAPATAETLTVRNDHGGIIKEYTKRVRQYDAIRIDGLCLSACVIYTMHPNACATKRAKLGFHWAYNYETGFSEKSTRAIYRNLLPSLQQAWPWEKIPKSEGEFIYARGLDHLPRCK